MLRGLVWYHLYNLKNVKNTHGGVLLLVKLQTYLVPFTQFEKREIHFLKLCKC